MTKVDMKSAYRNVPIHPEDRWLMGMLWDGDLYIDTALPFGLRSASKIFTTIADAAEWVVKQEGVDSVIHYLDNFLLVGPPASPECAGALTTLLSVVPLGKTFPETYVWGHETGSSPREAWCSFSF